MARYNESRGTWDSWGQEVGKLNAIILILRDVPSIYSFKYCIHYHFNFSRIDKRSSSIQLGVGKNSKKLINARWETINRYSKKFLSAWHR